MDEEQLPAQDVKRLTLRTQFGEISVDSTQIITFPDGLYGYEDCTEFVLWDDEKYRPFEWLISTQKEDLMFPLIEPVLVDPRYDPKIKEDAARVLTVVSIGRTPDQVTVNFKAPLILTDHGKTGRQIILDNPRYAIRHRMAPVSRKEG